MSYSVPIPDVLPAVSVLRASHCLSAALSTRLAFNRNPGVDKDAIVRCSSALGPEYRKVLFSVLPISFSFHIRVCLESGQLSCQPGKLSDPRSAVQLTARNATVALLALCKGLCDIIASQFRGFA